MKRIFINFVLLVSVFFFPWWATVIISIGAVTMQKRMYEIVGWGLVYDTLYGVSTVTLFGFSFFFTVGAFLLLCMAEFIKSKTRFSS